MAAGVGYAGRASGKWLFEVEVVSAQGDAFVGMAGTDFRGKTVGEHGASWAVYTDGDTYHGSARPPPHLLAPALPPPRCPRPPGVPAMRAAGPEVTPGVQQAVSRERHWAQGGHAVSAN